MSPDLYAVLYWHRARKLMTASSLKRLELAWLAPIGGLVQRRTVMWMLFFSRCTISHNICAGYVWVKDRVRISCDVFCVVTPLLIYSLSTTNSYSLSISFFSFLESYSYHCYYVCGYYYCCCYFLLMVITNIHFFYISGDFVSVRWITILP